MKYYAWLSVALIGGMISGTAAADSEIYTWRDTNGNLVFSQEGSSIPFDRDVSVLFLPDARKGRADGSAEEAPGTGSLPEVVVPVYDKAALPMVKVDVNDLTGIDFVVDTGATITVLNRALADALGIGPGDVVATRTLTTAQGTISASQVSLASLRVGDAAIEDLAAVVIDSDTLPNLLGRNFLNHFQVTMDPREQVLILRTPEEE